MAGSRRGRWIDALISIAIADGAQNQQTLFPGITPDELRNGTILRTVANLFIGSTVTAGAWGWGHTDIGLGVISQEAIGATAFPDPNSTSDYPVRGWTFRERCGVYQNGISTPILTSCRFDVSSQRKLDTGAYYLIANHVTIVGTAFATRLEGSVRTLVLMP